MIRWRDRREINKDEEEAINLVKISSVQILMSRKGDMLGKISVIKCRRELFDLRIIWIVKMKVEITGD